MALRVATQVNQVRDDDDDPHAHEQGCRHGCDQRERRGDRPAGRHDDNARQQADTRQEQSVLRDVMARQAGKDLGGISARRQAEQHTRR